LTEDQSLELARDEAATDLAPEERRRAELAREREAAATDLAVPDRAGAVVSEFVASVVEEANARAHQIMVEAEQGLGGRKEAALEGVDRVAARITALADELTKLRDAIGQEADVLTAELDKHGIARPVEPAPRSTEEQDAIDTVARSLRGGEEKGGRFRLRRRDRGEPHVDDLGEDRIEDAEVVPEEEHETAADQAARERVAAMSDEDLADAYAAALKDTQVAAADAAVQEALGRPAFQDAAPEPRAGLRARLSRRARRRAIAMGELRQACRAQREQRPQLTSGA
jgi:hypothetical protein